MKFITRLVAILLVSLFFVSPIFAGQIDLAYKKLFSVKISAEELVDLFADSFLKVVSEKQILQIVKVYTSTLGEFKSLNSSTKPMTLNFANGTAPSKIGFDSSGKINTLWFGAPELIDDNLEKVLGLFKKLEGDYSICLMKNGKDILVDVNSEKPMAIGSAFKLFILDALVTQVKSGKRSWKDVIQLKKEWKSFPSGFLQTWHDGANVTLETLAGLMISISDNTATDHLFNLVGRDELNSFFPKSCGIPFNTMEMFKLKIFFPTEGEKFIGGTDKEKLNILDKLAGISADQIASSAAIYNWKNPKWIDKIEWLVATRDLCKVIFKLKESKLIQINPAMGLVSKKDWAKVGFKGGSEPGVLNYTWVLQKTGEKDFYSLSCTINNKDQEIDSSDFNVAVPRLLQLILKGKI